MTIENSAIGIRFAAESRELGAHGMERIWERAPNAAGEMFDEVDIFIYNAAVSRWRCRGSELAWLGCFLCRNVIAMAPLGKRRAGTSTGLNSWSADWLSAFCRTIP